MAESAVKKILKIRCSGHVIAERTPPQEQGRSLANKIM